MKGYSQKNYHIGDGTLYSVLTPHQLRSGQTANGALGGDHRETVACGASEEKRSVASTYRGSTPGRGRGRTRRGRGSSKSVVAVRPGRTLKFHHQALPADYLAHYTRRHATQLSGDCSRGRTLGHQAYISSSLASSSSEPRAQLRDTAEDVTQLRMTKPELDQTAVATLNDACSAVANRQAKRRGRGRGSRAIPGFIQEVHDSMSVRRRRRIVVERTSFAGLASHPPPLLPILTGVMDVAHQPWGVKQTPVTCSPLLATCINSSYIGVPENAPTCLSVAAAASVSSESATGISPALLLQRLLRMHANRCGDDSTVDDGMRFGTTESTVDFNETTTQKLSLLGKEQRHRLLPEQTGIVSIAEGNMTNIEDEGEINVHDNTARAEAGRGVIRQSTHCEKPLNLCVRDSDTPDKSILTSAQETRHRYHNQRVRTPTDKSKSTKHRRRPRQLIASTSAEDGFPDVNICKFKFRGGATPSLQEKKSLALDSDGPFKFFHNERMSCTRRRSAIVKID